MRAPNCATGPNCQAPKGKQIQFEVLNMELFGRFLQERTYLKGVSRSMLDYCRPVRRAFFEILTQPTREGMLACIQKLLASGVSRISVNTYGRFLVYQVKPLVRVDTLTLFPVFTPNVTDQYGR
jgi:hypothetical protein